MTLQTEAPVLQQPHPLFSTSGGAAHWPGEGFVGPASRDDCTVPCERAAVTRTTRSERGSAVRAAGTAARPSGGAVPRGQTRLRSWWTSPRRTFAAQRVARCVDFCQSEK